MTAVFPDSRLRRAGANRDQVKAFGDHWSGLDEDARSDLARQIAGMHNRDVAALVEDIAGAPGTIYQAPVADDQDGDGGTDSEPGRLDEALKTVQSAKDHAEAHPEDVLAMLEAERAGKDRSTLVDHLQGLVDDAFGDDTGDQGSQDGDQDEPGGDEA